MPRLLTAEERKAILETARKATAEGTTALVDALMDVLDTAAALSDERLIWPHKAQSREAFCRSEAVIAYAARTFEAIVVDEIAALPESI